MSIPSTDRIIMASSWANMSLGLTNMNMPIAGVASPSTPYAQGVIGGISWFVVLAGGLTGKLIVGGSAYDTNFYAYMRWVGPTPPSLPSQLTDVTASLPAASAAAAAALTYIM